VILLVGQRLRDLRRGRKLKQEDLATILGVQNATVSHYETGKADLRDKVKGEIAKYAGVIIGTKRMKPVNTGVLPIQSQIEY